MKLKALSLALLSCACMASAHAAFDGAYAPAQWSLSNSNGGNGSVAVDSNASSNTLVLTSSNFTNFDAAPLGASVLSYSLVLAQDTTISFHWDYTTLDDNGSTADSFGYAVNGTAVQLSADGSYDAQSGDRSLLVQAGSTFSFQTTSQDSVFGSALTTISSFNAVSSVPEPEALALMLAGLGAMGGVLRRRARG